ELKSLPGPSGNCPYRDKYRPILHTLRQMCRLSGSHVENSWLRLETPPVFVFPTQTSLSSTPHKLPAQHCGSAPTGSVPPRRVPPGSPGRWLSPRRSATPAHL